MMNIAQGSTTSKVSSNHFMWTIAIRARHVTGK